MMNNSIYRKKYRLISSFLIAMLLSGCSSGQLALGNKDSDKSDEDISTNEKDADDEAAKDASADDSTKDSSSEEKSSEDLLVDSVTWDDSYDPTGNSDEDNKVYFNMSDGSVQTFEISSDYKIEDLKMVDLDNDGTEDYIISSYFANTATEYNIIYAYTFDDGQVSQLFPVSGIEGVEDDGLYDCQITDVTIDYATDATVNGLELTSFGKVDGMVYEDSHKIIYYQDGKWNLKSDYTDADAEYETIMAPRDKGYLVLDNESSKLYQAFLDGSEKATYDIEGDKGQYIEPSLVLSDGEKYTLDDITGNLTSADQYSEGWKVESVTDTYIDCGLDDDYEMVVSISFDTEFSFDMVIKNIDGSLKICYFGDSWSRCQTRICYNGMIYSYGSGGATSHGGYTGFINADGQYKLWYEEWEEGYDDYDGDGTFSVSPYIDGSSVDLTFDIPDAAYIYSEEISFDEGDGYDYYYFYILDEDSNELPDNPDDPDNPYEIVRTECEKAGITAISKKEHEEKLEERRQEIGLSDEIYEYGNEYLPEDE